MTTPQDIAARFDALINEELRLAEEHLANTYYTDLTTGRNVGQDELAAAKLARSAKTDFTASTSSEAYATELLARLMELKQSYDRIYDDFDGYGAGTFWSIMRGLTEYLDTAGVVLACNPYRSAEQGGGTELRDSFPTTEDKGIDYYEFERQLEDSVIFLQGHLKQGDYLLAFDFAQIHLLQLATRLYLTLPTISTAETLLFCQRMRRIQSVLVEIIYRARLPRIICIVVYRYIAAAGSLLTLVERVRKGQLETTARLTESKLPCSLLGLDYERAVRRSQNQQGNVGQYDDDVPHAMGYRLLTDLDEIVDESCANFLYWMFVKPEEIIREVPDLCTIVHYVVADTFQEDGWTVAVNAAALHCFVIQNSFGDARLSLTKIGTHTEVAGVVNRLAEAAGHAIAFGGDYSGGDLDADRKWLSERLLRTLEEEGLLGSGGLAIIAEGIMAAVPYAGLMTASEHMLAEEYDLVVAGGLRSLAKRWRVLFQEIERGAVVGSPEYDVVAGTATPINESDSTRRRFRPLPQARSECETVAKATQWELILRQEASVSNVTRLLPAVQAFHLVTHGVYDGTFAETKLADAVREPDEFFVYEQRVMAGAKVVLAGANATDTGQTSLVSAKDIAGIDVSQLRLAFLSLCVGSMGATVTGESLFGVARSFLAGGTTCVVASLFPVDDEIGERFAAIFYDHFAGSPVLSVTQCLKAAQMQLARELAPWYKWAGYQVLV